MQSIESNIYYNRPWTDKQFNRILWPRVQLNKDEIALLRKAGVYKSAAVKRKEIDALHVVARETRGNKRNYCLMEFGYDDDEPVSTSSSDGTKKTSVKRKRTSRKKKHSDY
eukprot:GHVL01044082.1.p1 GENE.GHVL01044082.1~~GHVL01044082.1.p1  ORF type:complete len:111 (-),score=14.43 GHVL01044082.1:187-519(-)